MTEKKPTSTAQDKPEDKKPTATEANPGRKSTKKAAKKSRQPRAETTTTSASKTQTAATPGKPAASKPPKTSGNKGVYVFLVIVLLILAGLAYVLWMLWNDNAALQNEVARQQSSSQTEVQRVLEQTESVQSQVEQATQTLASQDKKISNLEQQLKTSEEKYSSLNEAFQIMTDRGSDLLLLNDVDHLVTIAQQQLHLSGNVANAIMSLEAAQAQLARANRPALASLQQTINGDLEKLRAATVVDVAKLSDQLDTLAIMVYEAPLLIPDQAVSELSSGEAGESNEDTQSSVDSAVDENAAWWEQTWQHAKVWSLDTLSNLRNDLGEFVSVRRVDDATAMMISPDQAQRFRDNLRLRIMTAQLALMLGQDAVWEAETQAILTALETRFDSQSSKTREAIRIGRDVADADIAVTLPTVDNSMQALEELRDPEASDRSSQYSPALSSD